MTETKKIAIEMSMPVSVELTVSWDGENEQAEIVSASLHPMCSIGRLDVEDAASDDDLMEIDRLTAKAFGVNDDG